MTAAAAPSAVAAAAGTGTPVELGPDGGREALDVVVPPAAVLTKTIIIVLIQCHARYRVSYPPT